MLQMNQDELLLSTQKNRLNLHQYLFICLLVALFFLGVHIFLLGGRLFCGEIFLNGRVLMSGIYLWAFLSIEDLSIFEARGSIVCLDVIHQ